MLLAIFREYISTMYKQHSKLTRVEVEHSLEQEIFYDFKRLGSIDSDFYEDSFTLEEMLQIIFETMWNYESSTGILSKKYKEK